MDDRLPVEMKNVRLGPSVASPGGNHAIAVAPSRHRCNVGLFLWLFIRLLSVDRIDEPVPHGLS